MSVAVLFARRDSIYKTMPGLDVYDEERDALTYPGNAPVIAHPPCRAWGNLRHLAKPVPGEKELAIFAVDQVRKFGGVLEHPKRSTLWPAANLPAIGEVDEFGGWTLPVYQCWWGHRAEKATLLYIVGVRARDIPAMPLNLAEPTHVVAQSGRRRDGTQLPGRRPEISKADRERTPPEFARWLVELAKKCKQ